MRRRRRRTGVEVLDARELDVWCPDCGTGLLDLTFVGEAGVRHVHACADTDFCGYYVDAANVEA